MQEYLKSEAALTILVLGTVLVGFLVLAPVIQNVQHAIAGLF